MADQQALEANQGSLVPVTTGTSKRYGQVAELVFVLQNASRGSDDVQEEEDGSNGSTHHQSSHFRKSRWSRCASRHDADRDKRTNPRLSRNTLLSTTGTVGIPQPGPDTRSQPS